MRHLGIYFHLAGITPAVDQVIDQHVFPGPLPPLSELTEAELEAAQPSMRSLRGEYFSGEARLSYYDIRRFGMQRVRCRCTSHLTPEARVRVKGLGKG